MPPLLMLDPSLFLSPRSLRIVSSAWEAEELVDVVIPGSFAVALRDRAFPEEAFKFFGAPQGLGIFADAAGFVSRAPQIESYSAGPTLERQTLFLGALRRIVKDPLVFQILSEEWDFLTSHSWIASRTRRTFAAFIKAGAVAVETGRHTRDVLFDLVFEKRPGEIPRPLIGKKRLRRGCKWLATSGSSLASLHGPLPSVIAGITQATLFYLFDE